MGAIDPQHSIFELIFCFASQTRQAHPIDLRTTTFSRIHSALFLRSRTFETFNKVSSSQ